MTALGAAFSLVALACSSEDTPADSNETPPDDTPVGNAGNGGGGGEASGGAGGSGALPPAPPALDEMNRAQFEALMSRACGQCHGPDAVATQGGIDYINNLDELIDTGRIVPGDPEGSPIFARIEKGEMPPPGVERRVSDNELDAVARFIKGLPPLAPTVCTDQFIDFDTVYQEIVRDVFRQPAEDREFLRYLGITNRYNAGVCSQSLEDERHAMSKMVNSLSTDTRIQRPVAIDRDSLIYRIDIRDYDWDREVVVDGIVFEDGWEAIIASSQFAVEFEGDDVDNVKLQTGTTIPYLYSDAFIEQASFGNLYYALAGVPETKDELLALLDVDVEDNFDREIAVRAGFTTSAISLQDRVVERHPTNLGATGVFWDSFDFDPDEPGDNIFVDPFDFNANGSESLYTLPNGLHAYVIFDADGVRQEESNIIFDPRQEDFIVRSGISCMTCHAQGVNSFVDEVRSFALDNPLEYNADEFELLHDLYPPKDEMDRIIEDDRAAYRQALSRAGVPTTGRTDPISDSFLRFNNDVKVQVAAGDVHFPVENFTREVSRFNPALAGFRTGFSVDRDDWAGLYLETLCVVQVVSENRPLAELCD